MTKYFSRKLSFTSFSTGITAKETGPIAVYFWCNNGVRIKNVPVVVIIIPIIRNAIEDICIEHGMLVYLFRPLENLVVGLL
jgi:hypothetical protein